MPSERLRRAKMRVKMKTVDSEVCVGRQIRRISSLHSPIVQDLQSASLRGHQMACMRFLVYSSLVGLFVLPLGAQTGANLGTKVDSITTQVLQVTGVPSATVAVV